MITSIKLANFKIEQLKAELEAAYDTAATTRARQLSVIEELREQVKQQAAVIEQMSNWPTAEDCERLAEMLREVPGGIGEVIDALESIGYQKRCMISLQPCPEVLNKVRAESVRNGLTAWENTVEPIYKFMNEYAQRIEKGEA